MASGGESLISSSCLAKLMMGSTAPAALPPPHAAPAISWRHSRCPLTRCSWHSMTWTLSTRSLTRILCTCADVSLCAQDFANRLGCGNLKVESGFPDLDADVRSNYLANTTISGVELADVILLIGTNPRTEAPVFNARQAPLQAG